MRDDVRTALDITDSSSVEDRTIDIATTGRWSGAPRRIEICFYRFDDAIYLSGIPGPRTRDWLVNLASEPHFVFHLKNGVVVDLPAVATVITDQTERRRVFVKFVDDFNLRNGPGSGWPKAELEEWVERSPLVRVDFTESE
jgi:hypothetical protein